MARVSLVESEKMVNKLKGLRIFKFEVGETYRYIFPVDPLTEEVILYATPVHQINLGAQKGTSKCVDGYVQYEPGTTNLAIDPATGKPVNDGSCPYCEVLYLSNKIINIKMAVWREENPDASDKEVKEKFKELFSAMPVQKQKVQRGFIVARIATDKSGNVSSSEGGVGFELGFLPMSENQYITRFKTALKQYDDKAEWAELLFAYPEASSKMESAKNLQIMPVVKSVLINNPDIKDAIMEAVGELDLDTIEEKVYTFRPESISAIERKLASKTSALVDSLTEEQKEELNKTLTSNLANAEASTLEDVLNIVNDSDEEIDGEESGTDDDSLI